VTISIKLVREKGFSPVISYYRGDTCIDVLRMEHPLYVKLASNSGEVSIKHDQYNGCELKTNSISLRGQLNADDRTYLTFIDNFSVLDKNTIQLDRLVKVEKRGEKAGMQLITSFKTCFGSGTTFDDFWFLAPPAFYKHNDLDHDGVPDWLGSKDFMIAEDKLTSTGIMAYHTRAGIYIALIRADPPEYDKIDYTAINNIANNMLICETDIGSLGWFEDRNSHLPQMIFQGCYPFYEGPKSFILTKKGDPLSVFLPIWDGRAIHVSYRLRIGEATSFHEALRRHVQYMFSFHKPFPVRLPYSLQDSIHYRISLLKKFYREWDINGKKPAGFVLNFVANEGRVLGNILEYGFTGRNVLNAWCLLKYGYEEGDPECIERARKVVDFFVKVCQLPNGMFYNLYNVDKNSPSFWWVGLFTPLNYCKAEEIEHYMGPLQRDEYLRTVVNVLSKEKGCYFRSMCEEAYALLLCYDTERKHGCPKELWLESAIKFGDFLVKSQNNDGSWNKAYDTSGREILEPIVWTGTEHERKSDTASAIPFLLKLYKLTNDKRYLRSALKAGNFVLKNYVEPCEICSGHPDSPYTKGILITHESVGFTLESMLSLYEITKDKRFLDGATKVGYLYATWIYLWDVPFAENTTLSRYDFKSRGWGACDNCGAGYIHPYALYNLRDLLKLAEFTLDEIFIDLAEIIAYGQQQMLSNPAEKFGYPYIGVQEEGRFTGWLLAIDPIWQDRKMGGGKKGEGNKTVLGWVTAIALAGLYKVLEDFGTLDFQIIRRKILKSY